MLILTLIQKKAMCCITTPGSRDSADYFLYINAGTQLGPGCIQMSPQVGTQGSPPWTQLSTGWTLLSIADY